MNLVTHMHLNAQMYSYNIQDSFGNAKSYNQHVAIENKTVVESTSSCFLWSFDLYKRK